MKIGSISWGTNPPPVQRRLRDELRLLEQRLKLYPRPLGCTP
jgi:hypothetical protein